VSQEALGAWIILALIVGAWAHQWGRNEWAWLGAALLFSPLVAGIALIIKGRVPVEPALPAVPSRQCPACGSSVAVGQTRCAVCGHDFAAAAARLR
jgi:hypothetical protein